MKEELLLKAKEKFPEFLLLEIFQKEQKEKQRIKKINWIKAKCPKHGTFEKRYLERFNMTGSELLKQTEQLVQILNNIKYLVLEDDEKLSTNRLLKYTDKGVVTTLSLLSLREWGDELYDELSKKLGN